MNRKVYIISNGYYRVALPVHLPDVVINLFEYFHGGTIYIQRTIVKT